MVRITNNKLIIEIACNHESPLERLSNMQSGLMNLMAVIDHTDAPKTQVQDGLVHLKDLLKETLISPEQSALLNETIASNTKLKKEF